MADVSELLAMDRTTLTAALKPLTRDGLVRIEADPNDGRVRRLALTKKGHGALLAALPIWRATHDALEAELEAVRPDALREGLREIAFEGPSA